MKLKHTTRYIIFKISDDKKRIEIEKSGPIDKTYDDFKADLPMEPAEPRYCLIDFPTKTKDDVDTNKLIFLAWSPDDCSVKQKMLYASSKDALKKKFVGLAKDDICCTDKDEVQYDEVDKKVRG